MGALYSHTTRSTGTTLTAAIYNADHQNHIDNGVPAQLDDYSTNASQMQSTADPGEVSSESLATSLAGELERLRHQIKEIKDALRVSAVAQWYTTITGVNKVAADLALSGDISPSQLTANTDDWAPTGLSTAAVIRFSTDASRNITGLTGGADGRVILLHNVGSNDAVLVNDATSTAANRFLFGADITLGANQSIALWYDSTTSRWRALSTLLNVATQSVMETGTSVATIVTPGRQHFHAGHPKAWLKCDAAGNVNASYNVAGITDSGTGDLAVTIANDFSSAHYAIALGVTGGALHAGVTTGTQAAGNFSIEVRDTAGTLADPTNYFFIAAGDL